jgi:hypothetical protein
MMLERAGCCVEFGGCTDQCYVMDVPDTLLLILALRSLGSNDSAALHMQCDVNADLEKWNNAIHFVDQVEELCRSQ